jgi:hypothetical protein
METETDAHSEARSEARSISSPIPTNASTSSLTSLTYLMKSPEYQHIGEGQKEAEEEFESMASKEEQDEAAETLVPLPRLLQLGEKDTSINMNAM